MGFQIFHRQVKFALPAACSLVAGMLGFCLGFNGAAADDSRKRDFFETKIRPILIKHCYECHAANSKEIKGGLRVDTASALIEGGDSGAAVVKGKPEESPLIEAMRYEGVEMPPSGKLPPKVIADFEKWIADGAYDPRVDSHTTKSTKRKIDLAAGKKFWSFQPIRKVQPPQANSSWPVSDIDHFIFRKLQQAGLEPQEPASKRSLIRRIYFDLTGLPPTPTNVHSFLQDTSPRAFENVVDRLLNSKQFGVHWGRHWLDVARYADSNGADFNATFHNAWRYRDYVVNSFNDDKPFDLFVREQIAGDLMKASDEQDRANKIVATGFLMLGTKMLSERDKAKLEMDVIDEQINTVGQALIGMTLGCARCHDHKFDPIPTQDYYALAGIFKSTRTLKGESQQYVSTWPRRQLPASKEQLAAVAKFENQQAALKKQISSTQKERDDLRKQLAKLKSGFQSILVDDQAAKKIGLWKPSTISPNFIGKGYIHDDKSEKGEKWVEFPIRVPRTALYQTQISYNSNSGRDKKVPVSIKHADGETEVFVNQQRKPSIENQFEPLGKFRFEKDQATTITVATRGTELYVIVDAIRLIELDQQGQPVKRTDNASSGVRKSLQAAIEKTNQTLGRLEADLKTLLQGKPEPLPKALAVDEAEAIQDCQICIRGEHANLGKKIPRGFLQVASLPNQKRPGKHQSGRLELAEWLTSPNHPLTARVFVNRIWHHLIGQGIVPSVDNFGQLGDRPSHPELLDYLANDLIQSGWKPKSIIKKIVMSRTYQLSTDQTNATQANAREIDPDNRLLAYAHRKRLTAESIRDSILAISGKLELRPGPSPVSGLGTLVTQNNAEQTKFQPKQSQLRSIYLPMIRAEIADILTVFDFADPDLVTGRRPKTNVPAQALLLLNSPWVMQQAQATARNILKETASPQDFRRQCQLAYELVLSRPAKESEIERGTSFLLNSWRTESPEFALARFVHTLFASTEFRMLN